MSLVISSELYLIFYMTLRVRDYPEKREEEAQKGHVEAQCLMRVGPLLFLHKTRFASATFYITF